MLKRTLIPVVFLLASLLVCAADNKPDSNEKSNTAGVSQEASNKKATGFNYTFRLDNTINKNHTVDSVLVILDKFDRSGAGIVKKVFYPDVNNLITIEDLPEGKYYAEVYVLGSYKKHFSSVIRTVKANKKNKAKLHLDYNDFYTPGNVTIPEENIKLFAYNNK